MVIDNEPVKLVLDLILNVKWDHSLLILDHLSFGVYAVASDFLVSQEWYIG